MRSQLMAAEAEVQRVSAAMAKQDKDTAAVLAASGSEREALLGEQLSAGHTKVHASEAALAQAQAALASSRKRCEELEEASSRATARAEGA